MAEPAAVYVMKAMTGMSQNFFIVDFLFRVTIVAGFDTRAASGVLGLPGVSCNKLLPGDDATIAWIARRARFQQQSTTVADDR